MGHEAAHHLSNNRFQRVPAPVRVEFSPVAAALSLSTDLEASPSLGAAGRQPRQMSETTEESLAKLEDLSSGQEGVVARRQLTEIGIGRPFVRSQLRGKRWRRVLPGVYATFTGPLPDLARVWAAVLYAGPDAAASHQTAAWLNSLRPDLPERLDICVPHGHRHRGSRKTVRVRQSRHLAARVHPARLPQQTGLEDTVLDLTDAARSERPVVDVVLRACQQRLTTAARLTLTMRSRKRIRWRGLQKELLTDVRDGVLSTLERRYFRDVERAHGLPTGQRNCADDSGSRRRYRDVRYRRWRLVVELDGRAAHPAEERELDDLRDNQVAERAERTLRYGWRSVAATPCATAAQVARLLTQNGWKGTPVPCSPTCTVAGQLVSSEIRAIG
jgi:hypothetical protein